MPCGSLVGGWVLQIICRPLHRHGSVRRLVPLLHRRRRRLVLVAGEADLPDMPWLSAEVTGDVCGALCSLQPCGPCPRSAGRVCTTRGNHTVTVATTSSSPFMGPGRPSVSFPLLPQGLILRLSRLVRPHDPLHLRQQRSLQSLPLCQHPHSVTPL